MAKSAHSSQVNSPRRGASPRACEVVKVDDDPTPASTPKRSRYAPHPAKRSSSPRRERDTRARNRSLLKHERERDRSRHRRSRSREREDMYKEIRDLKRRVQELKDENRRLRNRNLELEDEKREQEAEPMGPVDDTSCALLVGFTEEVYNVPIANNLPVEKRGKALKKKCADFFQFFAERSWEIIDMKTRKVLFEDTEIARQRYSCVFRESGASLRMKTFRRWFLDPGPALSSYTLPKENLNLSFCIDFEKHENLVTPHPQRGRADGSLGTIGPKTQNLLILYEALASGKARKTKIMRMWIAQDAEKLGENPEIAQKDLEKHYLFELAWGLIVHTVIQRYRIAPSSLQVMSGILKKACVYSDYHKTPTLG